ncbi:hypothetical protein V3851_08540 [Paenibacillus sp. M1]|uniref:Uncharacterized protein n=1 Tax=Paenibacillus haidiansis TaxID=1574488 RepID=A0ABU7VQ34_9BACL
MPYHEFIVSEEQASLDNVTWNKHRVEINGLEVSPQASIDDELINYISDSLEWIKSKGPSKSFSGYGLDRYGYTVIRDKDSLVTFKNIISSWKDLFNNAPTQLVITGDYGWEAGTDKGQYEKISFNKYEVIESLNNLIEVIDTALERNQCVMHFGI